MLFLGFDFIRILIVFKGLFGEIRLDYGIWVMLLLVLFDTDFDGFLGFLRKLAWIFGLWVNGIVGNEDFMFLVLL